VQALGSDHAALAGTHSATASASREREAALAATLDAVERARSAAVEAAARAEAERGAAEARCVGLQHNLRQLAGELAHYKAKDDARLGLALSPPAGSSAGVSAASVASGAASARSPLNGHAYGGTASNTSYARHGGTTGTSLTYGSGPAPATPYSGAGGGMGSSNAAILARLTAQSSRGLPGAGAGAHSVPAAGPSASPLPRGRLQVSELGLGVNVAAAAAPARGASATSASAASGVHRSFREAFLQSVTQHQQEAQAQRPRVSGGAAAGAYSARGALSSPPGATYRSLSPPVGSAHFRTGSGGAASSRTGGSFSPRSPPAGVPSSAGALNGGGALSSPQQQRHLHSADSFMRGTVSSTLKQLGAPA
jgi:hypothetical protein